MGRPKKRRRPVEQTTEAPAESLGSPLQPTAALPQDPYFLSMPGRANAEFLPLNDFTPSFDFATSTFADPLLQFDPLLGFDDESPPPSTDLLDSGRSNFDSPEPKLNKENVHKIFHAIARHIFAQQVSSHDDHNPQVIPAVQDSSPSSSSQFKSHPNVTCPCLSSVYLTLDSLNNVSDDIPTAINTTRSAAKTAHEVLNCLVCSRPLVDLPLATPPMQSFQNMMLLSTLLASLSNAYFRLLELIDLTTAEAKSQNNMLRFSFRQLGGVWNELAAANGGECLLSISINESDLDPDVWRLAMRAVLRYEIYGFNTETPTTTTSCSADSPSPEHFGLAQAVRNLEERSRLRHEKLDVLVAAGHKLDWTSPITKQMTLCKGEKPQCMKIIECARMALDRLTIT